MALLKKDKNTNAENAKTKRGKKLSKGATIGIITSVIVAVGVAIAASVCALEQKTPQGQLNTNHTIEQDINTQNQGGNTQQQTETKQQQAEKLQQAYNKLNDSIIDVLGSALGTSTQSLNINYMGVNQDGNLFVNVSNTTHNTNYVFKKINVSELDNLTDLASTISSQKGYNIITESTALTKSTHHSESKVISSLKAGGYISLGEKVISVSCSKDAGTGASRGNKLLYSSTCNLVKQKANGEIVKTEIKIYNTGDVFENFEDAEFSMVKETKLSGVTKTYNQLKEGNFSELAGKISASTQKGGGMTM